MSAKLASAIKQQLLVNLQALVSAGKIASIASVDKSPNPLDTVAQAGYPLAIVHMPKITSDFEDQATNLRVYRFDVLFVLNPETLVNVDTDVEDLIDAILDQFDSNFTLDGTADGAVLAAELDGGPVSTANGSLLVFNVILKARAIYQIGT